MTLPLLLCTLIALTSGLHFGGRFAQAHHAGRSLLPATLTHGGVSTALVVVAALTDPTAARLLWLAVAAVSLIALATGALWRAPRPTRLALTDAPEALAPASRAA
ncbi:hypothetical protein [Deinococcus kurensis]|uniref:hypothetical protein n=1 Tax=Deinococcus kurensis TaxID=2662757 RepID=UPI0012D2F2B9|nr:hypothetical protein [Deinococcus kurensis]